MHSGGEKSTTSTSLGSSRSRGRQLGSTTCSWFENGQWRKVKQMQLHVARLGSNRSKGRQLGWTTGCDYASLMQPIWGDIWKRTIVEKSQINATTSWYPTEADEGNWVGRAAESRSHGWIGKPIHLSPSTSLTTNLKIWVWLTYRNYQLSWSAKHNFVDSRRHTWWSYDRIVSKISERTTLVRMQKCNSNGS